VTQIKSTDPTFAAERSEKSEYGVGHVPARVESPDTMSAALPIATAANLAHARRQSNDSR